MSQTEKIREFLTWMETCPFPDYEVTSMQGKTIIFVKFFLEKSQEKDTADEEERKLAEKDLQDEKL